MTFEGKVIKPIKLVNYNNKKHNKVMIEINLAPAGSMPDNMVYAITWDDGDTGYYELTDFFRIPLKDIGSSATIASHAMYAASFQQWFKNQKPGVNDQSEMGIYIYYQLTTQQ
jgi:hypothetical protein